MKPLRPFRLFLTCLLAGLAFVARGQLQPGDAFPPLASAGLAGPALPDLTGKIVLVDFCASWCAPCKASFPVYARLQAEFGPRGLVVVAISVDEDAAAFAGFARKTHPAFALVHDTGKTLVRAVKPPSMPTSYLLDRTGRVRSLHAGFHSDSTERELRREIEKLLAEPAATP